MNGDQDRTFDVPVAADLRQVMAKFYKFTCQYTGEVMPIGRLDVDHIVARTQGGADSLENYMLAATVENRWVKRSRDLAPELRAKMLLLARQNAPAILALLVVERERHGGRPTNPLAIEAFEILDLRPGTCVATGKFLRSLEDAAPGVKWWATLAGNDLQFGVKLLRQGEIYRHRILKAGFKERGNLTFYRVIHHSPIDRQALVKAYDDLRQVLARP